MKPFTNEQYLKLIENGRNSNETSDFPPVAKLYLTWTNCTWLLSELNPKDPDVAFGICDLGFGWPELGYVSIEEITSAQQGLSILESDQYFESEFPLSAYSNAAREMGRIVTDEPTIRKYNPGLQPK